MCVLYRQELCCDCLALDVMAIIVYPMSSLGFNLPLLNLFSPSPYLILPWYQGCARDEGQRTKSSQGEKKYPRANEIGECRKSLAARGIQEIPYPEEN